MNLQNKNIHLLKQFELNTDFKSHKPFEVSEIYNDEARTLIEIKISDGEILKKHKANASISVLCLAGNGIFKAGENLEDEVALTAGTFLILDAEIPHQVEATPKVYLMLTKFKTS